MIKRKNSDETQHKMTVLKFLEMWRKTPRQVLLQFIVTTMLLPQLTWGMPTPTGIHSVSVKDVLEAGEYMIELPFELQIFGNAKFKNVYINSVGGVSFGGSIFNSSLEMVKNRVIVFSPLLLMPHSPTEDTHISVKYDFEMSEKKEFELTFQEETGDSTLRVDNALVINMAEAATDVEAEGNSYEIVFVSGGDKTYVRYEYNRVKRIEDSNGYAKAGIFALEDGSVLCAAELPQSGTEAIGDLDEIAPTSFYWRIDLPLQCTKLDFDCKDPPKDSESKINADRQGYFFETQTVSAWSFHALYLCRSQHVKSDGSVMIRQGCIDDPDYYIYTWRELSSIHDQCFLANTALVNDEQELGDQGLHG